VLVRTVAPTELPLTIEELVGHLRADGATESDRADMLAYLRSAVSQLDGDMGLLNRAILSQTWAQKLDCFPACGYFDIPLPPLQSVTSITYLDENGDSQTLATSAYRVLNAGDPMNRGRIERASGATWPSTYTVQQAVTVTFVAGYGTRNDIPHHTRHLILFAVKEAYDHKTPVDAQSMMRTPAYEGLFNIARFPSFG
jgi:uncharacterized phiE125 gp8 family phage protein